MTTNDDVRLAIDLGASSGRVMAGRSVDGRLQLSEVHRFENAAVRIGDSLQWNIVGLWQSILDGLTIAARTFPQIRSMGVDSWGVDYVLVRRDGLVAGPVFSHRDRRTDDIIERATKVVSADQLFQATGLQFIPINTLFQLMCDNDGEGDSLRVADGFMMIGDYFHYLLTGRRSVEATNASTTQLLDPRNAAWRDDLIQSFQLPRKIFPDVVAPGTVLGKITTAVAAQTGLPAVRVIAPATHDTASAVLAVPTQGGKLANAPEQPDWCYISCGTWSLMGVELAEPLITPLCRELNYTNEGGAGESGQRTTRLLKNIGGLWVIQQIRRSIQRSGRSIEFADMVDLANAATPLTTIIDPDHRELHSPADMVEAVHAVVEQTGQSPIKDEATMFRAALEGLALRYRTSLDDLQRLIGGRIETVHIVGGGCQNELLCQMTADACDRTVIAGPVEATAIGNLIMQMIGDGEIATIAEARAMVADSFAVKTYMPSRDRAEWDQAYSRFSALS